MTVTRKIAVDLAVPRILPPVAMMQGDQYSRRIEITLTNEGVPLEPPAGTTVQVGYTRSDGSKGTYDALPNGSAAGSIAGNVVTLDVAPQVLSKPGQFPLTVILLSGDTQISTFPVMLQVTARPGHGGGTESGDSGGGSGSGGSTITEAYINSLIDAKLGVIENGTY